MNNPNEQPTSRFACRAVLREALTTTGPLEATLRAHVETCAFCAARVRARDRLVPLLRRRPELPAGSADATTRSTIGVCERIVERAENGPLGRMLAGALPLPSAVASSDHPDAASGEPAGWPEALLESRIARQAAVAPPAVASTAWTRVRESILDEVAGGQRRATRHHWWIGLLGTAVAAGIVLVVVQQQRPTPPSITFQDIADLPVGASIPSVDFAVVRRGATR